MSLGMMLPITGAKTKRFKHFHPEPGTDAYGEGQEQAKLNMESYHYIRALILGEYTIVDYVGPAESDAPPDEKHTSPKKHIRWYSDFVLTLFTVPPTA